MSIHLLPLRELPQHRHEPTHFSEKGSGYWQGQWPLRKNQKRPRDLLPVVYLLFDSWGILVYVGSTMHFLSRMKNHADKGFHSWAAFPCWDRKSAYNLEAKFLARHMPPYNRRREGIRQ